MRPEILYPLFAPVTALAGVGPRIGALIGKVAGTQVVDLLWHLPSGLIDRRFSPAVVDAPDGALVTLTLEIEAHSPPRSPRLPYKVHCRDDSGVIDLVFFHAKPDWLERNLPAGETRVVSGRVEYYQGTPQITHPDHIVALAERDSLMNVEPVYPMTAGLASRPLLRAVRQAVARAPDLPEWQDGPFLAQQGWAGWRESLVAAHAPQSAAELLPDAPARARLAYDELLANQLALLLIRTSQRKARGRALRGDGRFQAKVRAVLPFALTGAQETAIGEILSDMGSDRRMARLLQGDVGSGKTLTALMAMLNAAECGAQSVLMAPTEILARQHFATIAPLAEAAGVPVAYLSGRERGRDREAALARLVNGEAVIVIGTHALFQEDVRFHDLALAVIDEQHRFGVHQRLALSDKGRAVDVLVMTATPIPRTLTLTAYGDLDVSRLTEKPPGRQRVDTRVLPLTRLDDVIARLENAISGGARIFWVCPLVEESEQSDLAAASERHAALQRRFGTRVGLVHGRMKAGEKDAVMARFADGGLDILVATTVIEVGVDVPEATVMVIEHAERFGLAQLHQLRGRVGRGARPSSCLLLYAGPLGETARDRLNVMRETDDGFRIAEEDLRLRGAGELLGTRQSGLPVFRVADLAAHAELIEAARDDARLAVARDPELDSPRGTALRALLYLFERDAAVRTLRSG